MITEEFMIDIVNRCMSETQSTIEYDIDIFTTMIKFKYAPTVDYMEFKYMLKRVLNINENHKYEKHTVHDWCMRLYSY